MDQLFSNKKLEKQFLSLLLDGQAPPLMLTQQESLTYSHKSQTQIKEPTVRKVFRKTDGYELGEASMKVEREQVKEELVSKKGLNLEERRGLWNKRQRGAKDREFIAREAKQGKEFQFAPKRKKDAHDVEYDKGKLKKVKHKRIKKYQSFGEIVKEKNI